MSQALPDTEVYPPAARESRSSERLIGRLLVLVLGVALVFGVVRTFVVEPFSVPSESMAPTLHPGDHVLAAKFAYRLGQPHWGDIVVLKNPQDENELLIKRVVGLPGQRIEVRDGVLLVDGTRVREKYVDYDLTDSTFFGPVTVPAQHEFVLGDNRSNSIDSRDFGAVPEADLLGKVILHLG